jgi:hypothetical protein
MISASQKMRSHVEREEPSSRNTSLSHPPLPTIPSAFCRGSAAQAQVFEARDLFKQALESIPESDQTTRERLLCLLAQAEQVVGLTLPFAEAVRHMYRHVSETP